MRSPFENLLIVPLCQTSPISLKDRFSYLRKSQVTRSAEQIPKTPDSNLENFVPNIGATGLDRDRRSTNRLQKSIDVIIAFAPGLLLNLKKGFNGISNVQVIEIKLPALKGQI